MRRLAPAACAGLFLGALPIGEARAFRLAPMVAELKPSGPASSQTFTIENTGAQKLAVQLEAFTREIEPDGREVRKPTEDLSIYPDQVLLDPGGKRNVRVSWAGDAQPPRELAYRVVASQLPVEFKSKEKGKRASVNLQLLIQYVASLYVAPDNVRPQVGVEKVESGLPGKVKVFLRNAGTAHRLLKGARISLVREGGAAPIELPPSALKALETENILPGGARVFELALPPGAPAGPYRAEIRFDGL